MSSSLAEPRSRSLHCLAALFPPWKFEECELCKEITVFSLNFHFCVYVSVHAIRSLMMAKWENLASGNLFWKSLSHDFFFQSGK